MTHRSAVRTRRRPNAKYCAVERRRASGDDASRSAIRIAAGRRSGGQRRPSVRDAASPRSRPPRARCDIPAAGFGRTHTPTRCPSASSIRIHTRRPSGFGSRGREPRSIRPHGGKILGLQLVDEVCEVGIDDPTKLLAAAGRLCEHVATHVQEPRSTNLRRRPRATERLSNELADLRAEEVGPDRRHRRRSHIPVAQPQLVRDEHVSPLGVQHVRPISSIVQHRRPSPQQRMFRQRKRLEGLGHAHTECPMPALVASDCAYAQLQAALRMRPRTRHRAPRAVVAIIAISRWASVGPLAASWLRATGVARDLPGS